jgi:hypothetical protein
MTAATSKIVSVLVAALICVAGGLLAFGLTLWMPPPPAANTASDVDQILRDMRFEDLAATVERLPEHVVAVWVDPAVLGWPAPATSTGPAREPEPQATDSDDEEEEQDDGQPTAQPSAPDQGSATPAQPPYVGRVVRIDDLTQLAAGLDHMPATSAMTTRVKDGMWRTVTTPQTGPSTATAVTLAAVTALTGAVAALAMAMLWPRRRPRTAGAEPPDALWHPGGGPPSTPDLPPSAAWHAASPAPAPLTSQPPPPDLRVPALLTQRTTLVRGLADLAAKLPAEFEWQAANVLDEAGVRRIVPNGATFDPAAHHVVGTEPPPNAQLDDTVARTLRPGWADRGQVMVPARVVLYALPEQPPRGQDDDSG